MHPSARSIAAPLAAPLAGPLAAFTPMALAACSRRATISLRIAVTNIPSRTFVSRPW
jgi:hypothetical protein